MPELYRTYSHFNFSPEQWAEAAKRYLAMEESLDRLNQEDEEIDHDTLHENFERCAICEEIQELENDREEFAIEFAAIWAKRAIEAAGCDHDWRGIDTGRMCAKCLKMESL